jgi:hypothetical protein
MMLVAECLVPEKVDVLPGDGRDSLEQFQDLRVGRRLVAIRYPESRMEL